MLARIPLFILLLTIITGTGSLIIERFDAPVWLSDDPLRLAMELMNEDRMEEALYLARFSRQYLPPNPQYSASQIELEANASLASNIYLLERFLTGALTGEATDTPELIGTMTLDMLVIGDIRDLLVQGYKELDRGEGDKVIIGLSTVGLLLTLAPELSWAPALFKTFWRGRRFSKPFRKQIRMALSDARKTGDYRSLRKMVSHFSELVDALGAGPAMAVIKRVDNAEDLALVASKARTAPAEAYTLANISDVKSLENISTKGVKKGKLIKRVKLASRQQKLFGKVLGLLPVIWLLTAFGFSLLSLIALIAKGRKRRL
ncbi:MAG: hypothetical protein GXP23_01985 [Gammaproteobacteria bacterium]|nr:hypothetical protein [Gammaproteobacteria bacterium]